MAGAHINYQNQKSFLVLNDDTTTITTDCTGVLIENLGTVNVYMKCEGVNITFRPGESLEFSNDPDVMEVTVFTNIVFDNVTGDPDILPEKYLRVIREQITPYRDDSE